MNTTENNRTKPYFIYWFDTAANGPTYKSGHQAYIAKAKNEIDALKQWHQYLNGKHSSENFFRNSTYHAETAL